jgi:hypothetical protein
MQSDSLVNHTMFALIADNPKHIRLDIEQSVGSCRAEESSRSPAAGTLISSPSDGALGISCAEHDLT